MEKRIKLMRLYRIKDIMRFFFISLKNILMRVSTSFLLKAFLQIPFSMCFLQYFRYQVCWCHLLRTNSLWRWVSALWFHLFWFHSSFWFGQTKLLKRIKFERAKLCASINMSDLCNSKYSWKSTQHRIASC